MISKKRQIKSLSFQIESNLQKFTLHRARKFQLFSREKAARIILYAVCIENVTSGKSAFQIVSYPSYSWDFRHQLQHTDR